jgi:hypothetical protein
MRFHFCKRTLSTISSSPSRGSDVVNWMTALPSLYNAVLGLWTPKWFDYLQPIDSSGWKIGEFPSRFLYFTHILLH